MTKRSRPKTFLVALDREDRLLLEELAAREKLSLAETIRRALRAAAKRKKT